MIYGSTVQKLNDNLVKLRKAFGDHAVLTRQQVLDYAKSNGVKITSAFWVYQATTDDSYDLKTRDFTGMIGKGQRGERPVTPVAAPVAVRKAPVQQEAVA